LRAPPELAFVPRKLDLIEDSTGDAGPELLVQAGGVDGWWLGMAPNIRLPKASLQLKVHFPAAVRSGAEDAVLAALHARVVQRVLEQPTDMLATCGVSYTFADLSDGFELSFAGFDEHMADLVALVVPAVRDPGADASWAFEQARRQYVLDLADVARLESHQHALEAFESLTVRGAHSRAALLAAARDPGRVSLRAYRQLLATWFSMDTRLSALVAGNIGRERGRALVAEAAKGLGVRSQGVVAPANLASAPRVVRPSQTLEARLPNPIPGDPNSATLVVYQFGVPSIADRVHLSLLGEFMDRPVFEALRTERQLGYVVFGYVSRHHSIVEVRVLVQGVREAPDTVEALAEETLRKLTKLVDDMPAKELATRRHALRTELSKPPARLADFAGQYWNQILEGGENCFRRRAMQVAALDAENGTSSRLLAAAWRRALDGAPGGAPRKVVVKMYGEGAAGRPEDHDAAVRTGGIGAGDPSAIRERLDAEYWPREFICA